MKNENTTAPAGDSAAAFAFVSELAKEVSSGKVELPSFPDVAVRVRKVLADEQVSNEQIARIVGSDPGLAARVLTLSNSAALNRTGRNVADLKTAINRIGHNNVRTAAVSFAIAQLRRASELRVKDGINGAWTTLATQPIRQFGLNDNRIGILFESGEFRTKNGIHGAWTVHATEGVQSFQLQAHLIGMLTNDGQLRVRNVSNAALSSTEAYGAGVTQYRLIVDNPLPPHRTTPASYNAGQSRCRGMSGDPDCYPVTGFALPAPYYGVFCGLGRPTGDDFWGTVGGKAPIDGLDQMCLHHDMKAYWYAGHDDTEGEWDATCIVRYGLEYGRLTRSGGVIAHGDSSWDEWDAAWEGASMRNLWDGLNNYWTATNVCTDNMLAQFDAATDAQH